MRKNGFTLIELLAVIVILAIIALIAVPIVIHIIDDTKASSEKESVELYIDSVKKAVARKQLEKNNFNPATCEIQEDGNLLCGDTELAIDMKGAKAINGIIEFSNGKITEEETWIKMSNNSYYCYKNNKITKLTEDEIKLPKEYQKVEYIESTSEQYIDTGYKPNSNTKIELEYLPSPNYSGFMTIYGTQNNQSSGRFYGLVSGTPYYLQVNFSNNNSPTVWGFNKDGTSKTEGNGTFSPVLQRVKLSVDKSSVKIESQEYSNTYDMTGYSTWGNKVDCNHNLTIFARSTAGVVSNNFSGKIYYFKIYDNDTLVRDYIPVIDSSNIPCLYDKVEDKFYYNQGTGEFIKGPDV